MDSAQLQHSQGCQGFGSCSSFKIFQVLGLGKFTICLNKKVAPIFRWFPALARPATDKKYKSYPNLVAKVEERQAKVLHLQKDTGIRSGQNQRATHFVGHAPRAGLSPYQYVESLSTFVHHGPLWENGIPRSCWQHPFFWDYELIKIAWIVAWWVKTYQDPIPRPGVSSKWHETQWQDMARPSNFVQFVRKQMYPESLAVFRGAGPLEKHWLPQDSLEWHNPWTNLDLLRIIVI